MTGELARAAIVSVGNELLFGETINTNAAWLGRALAEKGIVVSHGYTVGDNRTDIQDVVRTATRSTDVVLISGGLGPTEDDITRNAVADLFERHSGLMKGCLPISKPGSVHMVTGSFPRLTFLRLKCLREQ